MSVRLVQLTESEAKRILSLVQPAHASMSPTDDEVAIGNKMRVVMMSFAAERVQGDTATTRSVSVRSHRGAR